MKILALRFKNINALKGDFKVDFTQPPLSEAGLFAITGPTGSGKTTLLDVMCLALYNQVPRLGRISKNTIEQSGAILTRHTQEAYAEVTYACHKGTFTSRWSISTARTGNLRDYEMQISREDGSLVDLKKSEVPATNESLIGLTYDQFIRSTLLAQGSFAKFLTSTKDERSALLEQITGTHIYRQLGRMAYERYKAVGDKLHDLRVSRETLLTDKASDKDLADWQQQQQRLGQQERVVREELKSLDALLEKWKHYHALKEDHTALFQQKQIAEAAWNEFTEQEGKQLDQHEALIPLQDELQGWREQRQQIQEKEQALQRVIQSVEMQQQEQKDIRLAAEKLLDQPLSDETVVPKLTALAEEVQRLEKEREEQASVYKHARELARQALAPSSLDWNGRIEEGTLRFFRQKKDKLANSIRTLEEKLPTDYAVRPQASREQLDQVMWQLKEWEQLEQTIIQAQQERSALQETIAQREKELAILPNQLNVAKQALMIAEKEVQRLEAEQEVKRLQQELSELRQQLQKDEPCPLCGSTDHPFAEHQPDKAPVNQALANARQQTKEKQEVVWQLEAKQQQLQERNVEENQKLEKGEQALQEQQAQLKAVQQRLGEPWVSKGWQEGQQQVAQWREDIGLLQEWWVDFKALKGIVPQLEKMAAAKKKGETLKVEIEALYRGPNVHRDTGALINQWTDLQGQIKNARIQLEQVKEAEQKARQVWSAIHAEVSAAVQTLGYEKVEEALAHWLPTETWRQWQTKRDTLQGRLKDIQSQLTALQQQLDKQAKGLSQKTEATLQQEQTVQRSQLERVVEEKQKVDASIHAQEQLQQRLAQIEAEMKQEEAANEKWRLLNTYIGDAKGKGFAEFAQALTLKQLTLLANERLQQLTKRYWIDTPEDSEEDTLIVIDRDMGDERRSVKTLSGGETFLVSLALALALSDLAAQSVKIESIFIDEGFGTLDPEVLDQTLDVLERLQLQDNKTIGIISHVAALKERITTQIQLQQDGQGLSRLEVV